MSTRRRDTDDFAAEIRAHLAHEADDLIEGGVSAAEAATAARRRFGNVTGAQERYYESQRWMPIDRVRQDVRDALRSLRRYPVATLVAIVSMAAGIGVTTATLTVRNIVFHNPPLGYARPHQLSTVQLGRGTRPIPPIGAYVPGELIALWSQALPPRSVAAAMPPRGIRDVRAGDRIETVPVRTVTEDLFDVLGVRPIAGSTFLGTSETPAPPAILSHRLWKMWFDASPAAIGQTIFIENRPHTIVGVMPPGFWFSEMRAPVWTRLDRGALAAEDALEVVVRRPDGMSPAALAAQLEPAMAAYAARLPADQRHLRLKVSAVEGTPAGRQMSVVLPYVLGSAALLTLLIACANVAILTIAQWTTREHEISIRASIGASRRRLIQSLLVESLLTAFAGGLLGITATLGIRAFIMRSAGSSGEAFMNLAIPAAVFVQCLLATVVAGLLTGIAPALFETRRLHDNPMRVSGTTDQLRQRWRHALVVVEIGVTVALLVVAGAFIDGYRRTLNADLGFDTRPMLAARVENPKGVPIASVLDALAAIPGISSAAASTTIPFVASGVPARAAIDADGTVSIPAERAAATPAFFSTLGVTIRSGRVFTGQDSAESRTAVVNVALGRKLFGSEDVVGRRVYVDKVAYDIVGVVTNFANQQFFRDYDARVFLPLATSPAPPAAAFVIRARDDPSPLLQTARRTIRDAAAGNVVVGAFTFEAIKTTASQEILVGTAPLAPLIAIGLLMTTAGIYGVLAFAIARRSRELAVRVAIGASGRDLVRLVSGHTARLVATGTLLGLGLTFALSRIVRSSGGAGSVFDPDWPAFAAPLVIIAVVGVLATWIPSRRVRKIDPARLLRV